MLTSSRSKLWPSVASSSDSATPPSTRELVAGHYLDRRHLVGVALVLDLAHDLLQDVLEGHDAGGAAELVHHDGQVAGAALEVAKLAVERLALRARTRPAG